MTLKKDYFVYILIILILFLPWFNSDSDQISFIPELSQEDNPFYEINPCKISLFEFFNANKKSLFQDHYFFRPNNDSSINCFGKITGISVQQKNLETEFIVSVGTNSLVNFLLQGSLWLLLISFVKKTNLVAKSNFRFHEIAILATSYLLTYSIYAQQRFYEANIYLLDLSKNSSYILIFLIFLFLTKNLIELYIARSSKLINMVPFIFLLSGIFSGSNLVLFSFIFIYSGIKALFEKKYNKKIVTTYLVLSFWWLINSNGSFYFNPGKFRGFTNSVYEFNSNLYWIIFFLLLVLGVLRELHLHLEYFNLQEFSKYFSISSAVILITGLIGSNFPSLNFLATYYFGLQRNVVELTNPFIFDEFGVKISWRGMSPSSETIGEFFGLCLLINLFSILQKSNLDKYNYIGILSSGIGLYFSDNRTSILIVFVIVLFFFVRANNQVMDIVKKHSKKIKISFSISAIIMLYIFLQTDTYTFYSESLLGNSQLYQYDSIFSSYLNLLSFSFEEENFLFYVFGFFSVLGYLLNRAEMWGIFFARYNPTAMELVVGSGPLTLGQLYGEIKIEDLSSFLLPHSSLLSYIVYFGLLPTIYGLYILFSAMKKNKSNTMFLSVSIYMILNIIKNDSLNYFPVFVLYVYLLIIFNKFSFAKEKS
jgi:hypothetical protein